MASVRRIGPGDALFLLAMAAIVYGGIKFVPPFIEDHRIGAAIQEVVATSDRQTTPAALRKRVVETLSRWDIEYDPKEDLEVVADREGVRVEITYDSLVHHPFGRVTRLTFHHTSEKSHSTEW